MDCLGIHTSEDIMHFQSAVDTLRHHLIASHHHQQDRLHISSTSSADLTEATAYPTLPMRSDGDIHAAAIV